MIKRKIKTGKIPFDKYWHYRHSVQSPEMDVRFLQRCYRQLKKQTAFIFREDFCSTFALSCEWVKMGRNYKAICVDIDKEPLEYGKKKYLPILKPHQSQRIQIVQSNVLKTNLPKANIIGVFNFSYFIFKERKTLKRYFSNCLKCLKSKGIFVLDCFGGSGCYESNEEEEKHKDFTYFWDQENFDPISHNAMFRIHYKRRGEKKRKNVFSYDWRMWGIPEIRDLLDEVGFRKSHVYWEGNNKHGEGNGKFRRSTKGEECESWIAYIIAEK